MSRSLNKVMLIGNVGSDPEVRSTASGTRLAKMSLATNRQWTNKDGSEQEKTEWHRLTVWGKLADVVLWRPAFFGIKPELVIKGGFIAWAAMGDSAASLMTCEPLAMRPQWGAFGRAKEELSVSFVSQEAVERRIGEKLGLAKRLVGVAG